MEKDEKNQSKKNQPNKEVNHEYLTTNQGVKLNHVDDSLKAGSRGPTLMEDFHFRERMTHFDHESIPERVVHARGSGAHGYFQVYDNSMSKYTKAKFLTDPSLKTPVFVRFSTVVGSRGSADTVRDVRGFATKFYTVEGNYDLVGNNIPIFFIQDGNKFPDLVHSIKPEPHHEMPQASAAHDNFWDFISLMPESMHMIMWLLSDRGIPRSFRMMEGFGVHTFRFINNEGKPTFVKLHWKPVLGTHSLVFDEAQKLAGKDPDWLRRDLWEAIDGGDYPEFELGVQLVDHDDEFKFDFDLLDATKIIPEELVPVQRIGKMTLNRNPDNFFEETEQVAFHPGHVVPGIDVTNDPLLQGRLFSYLDTQLTRLGGPNFAQIPINSPHVPVNNHQGAGFMRMGNSKRKVNYHPNSVGGGCPFLAGEDMGGYAHYAEKVDGHKIRERSESFKDHFSQATLFWNSMTEPEKKHIISAFHFELGKVDSKEVRQRMFEQISKVDLELAVHVAKGIGVSPPQNETIAKVKEGAEKVTDTIKNPFEGKPKVDKSPAVSIEAGKAADNIKTRQIAFLLADGFDDEQVSKVKQALMDKGAKVKIVSKFRGTLKGKNGKEVEVDKNHVTTASIMYDAIFIPGGKDNLEQLMMQGDAIHFVNEAYKHHKPIAAIGEGVGLLIKSEIRGVRFSEKEGDQMVTDKGVVTSQNTNDLNGFNDQFFKAIAKHRHWEREEKGMIPA